MTNTDYITTSQKYDWKLQALHFHFSRIQNLTASIECGTLSPADSERLAECKASLEDCRVQFAAAQQVLSAAPENFDTRIKAIEEEITEKKIMMKDVKRKIVFLYLICYNSKGN